MSGKQPSGFNLTERSDSGDNRGTMPKPKRRGTQNLDQLERMSIENARLTKLDQRSRDLKEAREKFPRALSKSKWLDYPRVAQRDNSKQAT